jgi:hypothetical protein
LTRAEVEKMTSTSAKKKILLGFLILAFVSSVSADFYYSQNSGSSLSSENYFSIPEYDSQYEIGTQLVAPFIFITTLLHFALSKALSFILANDSDDPLNDARVLMGLPRGVEQRGDRLDVSRYSMIMSLTITASLIPTPYWDMIRGIIQLIGVGSLVFFAGAVAFVLYLMIR